MRHSVTLSAFKQNKQSIETQQPIHVFETIGGENGKGNTGKRPREKDTMSQQDLHGIIEPNIVDQRGMSNDYRQEFSTTQKSSKKKQLQGDAIYSSMPVIKTGQKSRDNNSHSPYLDWVKKENEHLIQSAEALSSGKIERPRMTKSKDGVPRKEISTAEIMGDEEHNHLPVYVDKVRTYEQVIDDHKQLSDKYLTRTSMVKLQKAAAKTRSSAISAHEGTNSSRKDDHSSQRKKLSTRYGKNQASSINETKSLVEPDLSLAMIGDSIVLAEQRSPRVDIKFKVTVEEHEEQYPPKLLEQVSSKKLEQVSSQKLIHQKPAEDELD